ncbi:MAG: iron-containing alcohol dehydrogenase [Ruminococcaceae bacterium]|nr:iron-containing alcohol dehydrogenase [Oscillospiraceae bacterium]
MILEDLTQLRNLKQMVDYAAENFADTDFIQYKVPGGTGSKKYSRLKKDCDAFSLMLEDKGLRGAHVAVIGATSYNWIVTYFGTVATESVIVPLATTETTEMNCRLMDFSDADVLVFDEKCKPLYKAAREQLHGIKLFISSDDTADEDGVENFSDILKKYKGEYHKEPDAEKTCAIMFTSGTTGFPKGVMLSHKNLVYSATSVHIACPTTKMFCCLPIHHGFCFTANITKSICKGKTVCVNDNLADIVPDLRLFKPDSIVAVPQIIKKLMGGALKYASSKPDMTEEEAVREFLGGNIIDIISGGAPLDAALNERFNATGVLVLNGYGMTECSPIISNNAVGNFRHGSVGMPIPCMDVKIVDGEILVKGPSVMQGYYKNPEATKEAFTEDGYLHTGDVGHFDDDGFLYITGRCKNLILLDNGENVSAEMLEDKFSFEPMVQEVVCFGEDGAIYAEIYPDKTYIAENNITDIDKAMIEMLMRVNSTLAGFQRVSAYILRDTPFERTASSKIKRGAHGAVKKAAPVEPETPEEKKVFDAVKELLGLSILSMTDNFFAVGGDSLNAVELAVSLNIKPQEVYDNPFLYALANKLKENTETEADGISNINELILETESPDIPEIKYSSALLTGATGFLGIHILKELIDSGLKVYCLVRNEKKLLSQIKYYFGSLDMTNIRVVPGNIEAHRLGLSKEDYETLAKEVDVVYHVAANVHHAGDYCDLERTNVGGTKNVIDFCFFADAVLQHTSTVSVHGAATVRQSFKNAVFHEHILDIGQHYCDNVYIHSKYRAEEAVIEARTRGLKANIYRIGNLTWRASDGKFQSNSADNGFLHRLHAMLKLGLYHENMDKYPMDLTAVDECADAFVKLSLLGKVNEIYHLFNHNFLDSRDMFEFLGVSYRHVSATEMIETAFANTSDRDIHVYLFYMIISGRSQNVPMYNDFTLSRLRKTGFRWSIPDKKYLTVSSDGEKGLCLDFDPVEIKSMRKTGGILNPIQKLTLGVLKNAYPVDSKVIRGAGKIAELKNELGLMGVKRPLVITLPNADSFKGINTFINSFSEKPVVFDAIYGEPTVKNTDDALALYIENGCDSVVGIGGGSVLDTAKIVALRANNRDSVIDDICKLESDANMSVPLFLVPTTAGTGSEVTFFAVATEEEENKKRPFVSDKYLPDVVILDPELTLTVPAKSTAFTGIDAMSHAIESYVSLFASAFEEDAALSPDVCKDIFAHLYNACLNPADIFSREVLQNAAFNAGLSFRRIGTGYIHAIGHRLGEFCHIPHGLAIAVCIAPVLRAYLPFGADKLSELALHCGIGSVTDTNEVNAENFISAIEKLIGKLGISADSIEFNEGDIDEITRRSQEEAKIIGYPRPFSDEELKSIILSIFR